MVGKDRITLFATSIVTVGLCVLVGVRIYRLKHPPMTPVVASHVAAVNSGDASPGHLAGVVTVVAFVDYECPACRRMVAPLNQLASRYSSQMRLRIRNFPLKGHPHAIAAATAAEAAKQQGLFWPAYEAIFKLNGRLDEPSIRQAMATIGADMTRFDTDRKSVGAHTVALDVEAARALSLTYTPGLFLCDPHGQVWRASMVQQLADALNSGYLAPRPFP